MAPSYYTVLDENSDERSADGASAIRLGSNAETTGPWAPHLQHGGPPNALAVELAQRAVTRATGRDDLVALRLASDFVGPVPVGELEASTRIVRAARSAVLAGVTISAGGRECLHSRVWFVRDADTSHVAPDVPAAAAPPADAPSLDADFPFGRSIEWRRITGGLREPGPAAAWARPRIPLLPDLDYCGLSRAVLIADSGNGLSSELDWTQWSFLNVDLDVHLARPLLGEWVLLDAATQLGAHGSALARSTLSDVHGPVGSGLQTLVLAPVRT